MTNNNRCGRHASLLASLAVACGEQHGVRLWAAESLCAAPAQQQGRLAGEPQAGRAGDQALQHMQVRSLRASGDVAWPRDACGMCMGSMLPGRVSGRRDARLQTHPVAWFLRAAGLRRTAARSRRRLAWLQESAAR